MKCTGSGGSRRLAPGDNVPCSQSRRLWLRQIRCAARARAEGRGRAPVLVESTRRDDREKYDPFILRYYCSFQRESGLFLQTSSSRTSFCPSKELLYSCVNLLYSRHYVREVLEKMIWDIMHTNFVYLLVMQ